MRLKFHSYEIITWALLKAFFFNEKIILFLASSKPNDEDGMHQISLKINENVGEISDYLAKLGYKLVIFSIVVMSQVFV
jgi:hypothetical protein